MEKTKEKVEKIMRRSWKTQTSEIEVFHRAASSQLHHVVQNCTITQSVPR